MDRRNSSLRDLLVDKLRSELNQVPGIALTTAQVSRPIDGPPAVCDRVLAELAHEGEPQSRGASRNRNSQA